MQELISKQELFFSNSRRKLSDLIPADWNPRKINDKQAKDLKASLEKFSLAEVPIVNLDNLIIAGHQRVKILYQLYKDIEIDVRIPSRLMTDEEVKEYNIRSNKNTGEFDFEMLANHFDASDLVDWGFDENEVAWDAPVEGLCDEDEVPAVPEIPITVLGDVWLLGDHRLMCGDSTSIDAVEKLMGGHKSDMIFTDPPYGMSYGGGRARGNNSFDKTTGGVKVKAHGVILGDDLRGDDLVDMIADSLLSAKTNTKEGAAFYVCFPWRTYSEFETALIGIDLKPSACIVWDKKSIGLGNANYRPQHEFIFYIKGGAWYGDKGQSDVWSMSRGAVQEYVHPTQKPVELIEIALNNSSKAGDYIHDCFGGFGSTMIACEKTGRINTSMELDPKYCDVIIKRWEKFTGKQAKHAETGKPFGESKLS